MTLRWESTVAKIDYTLESICILLMIHKAFIEHLIVGIKCMWYWFYHVWGDLVVVLPNFWSSFLLTWYMCFFQIYSPRCNTYVPNYQICIICATKCWTTLFFKLLLLLLNHPIAYPLVCHGPHKFAFLFCLGALWALSVFLVKLVCWLMSLFWLILAIIIKLYWAFNLLIFGVILTFSVTKRIHGFGPLLEHFCLFFFPSFQVFTWSREFWMCLFLFCLVDI